MLYKFNKENLTFNKIGVFTLIKLGLVVVLFGSVSYLITYRLGLKAGENKTIEIHIKDMSTEEKRLFIETTMEVDTFSMDALVIELKELNVRFPHIVLAQSILETGHFGSNVFRANNNLFGMKEARQRCKTAKGTNLGHAYYNNWKESVMDYALFQSAYLRDLKTEKKYLRYLDKNYAMGSNYDVKVVDIINKENLRELF